MPLPASLRSIGWTTVLVCLVCASSARAQDAEVEPLVPPRLIEAPEVVLPPDAPPLPEGASVVVEMTIARDGSVRDPDVVDSPRPDLEAPVREAALASRFEPATRGGEPIAGRVRFRFRIAVSATPPPDTPAPNASEARDSEAARDPDPGADAVAEVGVTATIDQEESGAADRITLRGAELTTVPGTFGDPVRVVAALPGVARSPFGLGYFLVRGANFQNTGYFVDDFPVPILYHLGAGPSVLPASFVDRLRFYPGGYPVAYGRYTAGIVGLDTAVPSIDGDFRAEVQLDGYRGAAIATVVLPDRLGSITASFRRSYFDLVFPLYQEIYGRAAEDVVYNPFAGIQFYYLDVTVRAQLRLHPRVDASVLILGSEDSFDQRGTLSGGRASEGARTNLGIDFQRLIARLRFRMDGGATLSVAGMLGRDANRFNSGQPGRADLSFDQVGYAGGLRVDGRIPWDEHLRTRFGVDVLANLLEVEATLPTPPGFGEVPRPAFDPQLLTVGRRLVNETAAVYLEQVFDFDPIEVSAGGRFELMRHARRADVYPDPRLVARWRIVPELTMKVASGLFSQPPDPYSASPQGGNPDLPAERSWQSSGGFEATLPESVHARVTGYYTRFFQLTRTTDAVRTGEDGQLERVAALGDGEGQAYGLEVLLRRRIERGLFGWVSYTLSRSERFVDGGQAVPFQFDQTHVLNLALSYGWDGWRIGARFQLATGAWTTRYEGASYDVDGGFYAPNRRGLSDRLPTYHRLDIRLDKQFALGPLRGAVFFDIQNVYNAPSQEGVLYQYDFRASAALPGIPFLPTVGVQFYYEPGVTDAGEPEPTAPERLDDEALLQRLPMPAAESVR